MASLIQQLTELPDHWGFVAVGNDKRPYQPEWQKHPLTKHQLAKEIESGRAVAVGVIAGPQSGGLLFVDHDGLGASQVLDSIGLPLRELPKSWAVTSGRDGRLQVLYQVPQSFWAQIKTTKLKSDIKGEQLELRWAGCQSVVLGAHPITGSYHWLRNRAPHELDMAEAPSLLLQQMMRKPEPAPLLRLPDRTTDAQRARDYLSRVPTTNADDYDEWVKVGMALHSVGDDGLLSDWIHWSAASGKFESGLCEAKWKSFTGSGGVGLGTLHHLADPAPITKQHTPQSTPRTGKPLKLEADELMTLMRQQLGARLRWNVFNQSIELDTKSIDNIELYYLQFAEQGVKVSKELAADCLHHIALENQYDPVKEYLDTVAEQVPPVPIDHLATAYIRTRDTPGTLYDTMLKATLIAAVRRIYEPGSKHDAACVLMGPQGCGKSTFWRNLGGPWFSDALRDVASRDDLLVLHRSWVMEWAELDHITGRKHAGQVKAFLSQQVDTFRAPYARSTQSYPRRCVIVGSTNKDSGFLIDETGNRRFWVIPVDLADQMIQVDGLMLERDAIWSAAVAAYKAGEPNHLTHEQGAAVDLENETYMVESPWLAPIEAWLREARNVGRPISCELLLTDAVGKPAERQTKADQMHVSGILKDLGWVRYRDCTGGKRQWRWKLPTSAKWVGS